MGIFVDTLANFLGIYLSLLLVRVIFSWFPSVDWFNPALAVIHQLTDPYINWFRAIIPPIAGMDLSASFAIIVLAVVQNGVDTLAGSTFTF